MASLIQKAADGNRAALEALYETNKGAIYSLSYGLVRNTQIAANAAGQALQSAMQMIFAGTIQTEQAFTEFALKQAASHCRTEVLKQQPKAFMIPPKKDFRIPSIPEDRIGRHAGPLENYLNLLPTFQRFVLVLRHSHLHPRHEQGAGTGSGNDGKPAEAGTLISQRQKTEGRPSQSASLTAPPEGEPRRILRFLRFFLPLPMGEVARRKP